ncbi:hypothetical protein [Actinoplanes sp. DH11]|uniref:hypothetical protein n=1 Tax=Actinoplanes sp. DH11 TaxID=2857011 RepID=UPI001E53D961|nr:hypothetical protein [Actinoplanes sp. DH11]
MDLIDSDARDRARTVPVVAGRLVLLLLAAAAAVLWAVGVTELQPLSEPAGPDAFGENNTYWARELRWGALLALVVTLIVLGRGGRWASLGALIAGGAWLATDIWLDRAGFTSGTTAFFIGAAVVALICGGAVIPIPARAATPAEPSNDHPGRPASPVPGPGVTFAAALVAAVAAGVVTATESPTDVETGLNLGSAAAGSLLALVAVAGAAATGRPRARAALVTAVLAGAVPWLVRLVQPMPSGGRWLGILAFTVLLVVAVVALAGARHDIASHAARYGGVAILAATLMPVTFMILTVAGTVTQAGAPWTALAGNPAIHDADSDIVLVAGAIPIGLLLALVTWGVRHDPDR